MKPFSPLMLLLLFILISLPEAIAQPSAVTGKDTITASEGALSAVTVSAGKAFIEQKVNKLIINVAQSPMAAGDNIYEVIKRAPGIREENGLKFNGKRADVYINGTPTRLSAEELQTYLSSMPASSIEKVEVIGSPTASYEATGGAVINIILAKNKNLGTNGSFTAGTGMGKYGRYNTGILLNHRNAHMNIYGSYDIMHIKTTGHTNAQRFIMANAQVNETGNNTDNNNSHTFKAGIDYTFSAQSGAGILFRGSIINKKRETANESLLHYYQNEKASADTASVLSNHNYNRYFTPAVNIYYKLKTGKSGQLSVNGDYYQYQRTRDDQFVTRYLNEAQQEYQAPLLLRNQSAPQNHISSLSADYTFTAGKIKYETGSKVIFTHTDNDLSWETLHNNEWQRDNTKSNHFVFDEHVYAAYFSGARTLGKFDLQAGLRMEHTNTTGNSLTLNQVNKKQFTDLFPSLDIMYTLTAKQQLGFTYRRKIERFRFNTVNPFITYSGPYTREQGNPSIKPTYSGNFELNWSYGSSWMANITYSHYTDVQADVFRKGSEENVLISTTDNVDGAGEWNATITNTQKLFNRKLSTSNTLMGMHAQYYAAVGSGLNSAAFAGGFTSINKYTISENCRAEMTLNYLSPLAFGAYHIQSVFTAGIGISHQLWHKKGTLSLNVTDLFNGSRNYFSAHSYNVRSNTYFKPESRFIKLSFTWRFGNQQVKAAAARRTGIEEAKNRMD